MTVKDFKQFPQRMINPEFQGTQLIAQVVGVCTCGNGTPIVLILTPGSPSATTCGACKTTYKVSSLSFDENDNQLKLKIGKSIPNIVPAG